MMECPGAPSRIVTRCGRSLLSAPDLYFVFGSHDREAAVQSARPQAGQDASLSRRVREFRVAPAPGAREQTQSDQANEPKDYEQRQFLRGV